MKTLTRLTTLLAILLLAPSASGQKSIEGRVVGVADGDTLSVLDSSNRQHRVRCQGIDAPERAQDFGEVSHQGLSGLTFGKQTRVSYAKRDRYGRIVGVVTVGGRDACLAQVRAGLAWHYKQYQSEQSAAEREAYAAAELDARAARSGLWRDPAPRAPWDFRRGGAPPRPSSRAETAAHAEDVEAAVYITRTGEKYHRGTCRYLARSKFLISLKGAKTRGYEPCKVCRPPR